MDDRLHELMEQLRGTVATIAREFGVYTTIGVLDMTKSGLMDVQWAYIEDKFKEDGDDR